MIIKSTKLNVLRSGKRRLGSLVRGVARTVLASTPPVPRMKKEKASLLIQKIPHDLEDART